MKSKIILTLLLLMSCYLAKSQTPIESYSFDNDLGGWTSVNLLSNNQGFWSWTSKGKADLGIYWNGRDSIYSTSLGGAAVMDGDGNLAAGIGNADTPFGTGLVSPLLNFSTSPKIFLKFNQYYRSFNGGTRIEVSIDGGNMWDSYPVNNDVLQNVETSAGDEQVIDISSSAGGVGEVLVRFVFFGNYYYWIIDDVEFYDEDPSPQTFPTRYSDSLEVYGYPFEIDNSNWAYIPNELVVQFKDGVTAIERQELRDSLGASLKESCVCDRLELWEFGVTGGDTLSGTGNSIGINENAKKSKGSSKIDGVDVNRYNFSQFNNPAILPNDWLTDAPSNINPAPADAIRIGILDTGIDYGHDDLVDYIYRYNQDENCLNDDFIGWNYVHDNNNPYDDHSHGTHVAGIIKQNLEDNNPNCQFRIIPYKTHDLHGTSNLFDVTCATYQAMVDSVSVINDSWGFYGDSSIILSNAVDTLREYDILVVTASGNDSLDLSQNAQYPACYAAPNIITVGSYETPDIQHSIFSNYDPMSVDILAKGRDINSTVPLYYSGTGYAKKTGTSMSAPAVTAAAAIAYCSGHTRYDWVKDNVLNCAQKISSLSDTILDGNILSYNVPCLTPTEELFDIQPESFTIYPNPFIDQLSIVPNQEMEGVQIQILNLTGQVIYQEHISNWMNSSAAEILIPKISAGIYLLKIQTNDYIWSYKLLKI